MATDYVLRYEMHGSFSRVSEPVKADSPREAAEAVAQREDGPLADIMDALSGDDVLHIHELGPGDTVTVGKLTDTKGNE